MTHEEQISIVRKHGLSIYVGTKKPQYGPEISEYTAKASLTDSTGWGYDPYRALVSLCDSAGLTSEDRQRATAALTEIRGVTNFHGLCLTAFAECSRTQQRSTCHSEDPLWKTYSCFPYARPD